jgi:hypothetical protein
MKLEEGVCDGFSVQSDGDSAVTLDSGDALGVLAYNITARRRV